MTRRALIRIAAARFVEYLAETRSLDRVEELIKLDELPGKMDVKQCVRDFNAPANTSVADLRDAMLRAVRYLRGDDLIGGL